MEDFISLEKIIDEAKKKGVDFGKGDPYNRLRYYTKIGWLPHMIRKNENGGIKGHYPIWTLKRLILIEKFKSRGFSNEEISVKINAQNKVSEFYASLTRPENKTKIVTYLSFVILLIILLSELGYIKIGKQKSIIITQNQDRVSNQFLDSGISIIPVSKNGVLVKSPSIKNNSKINVTFNASYSPATKYWISQKTPYESFFVELDVPVSQDSQFSWWISE